MPSVTGILDAAGPPRADPGTDEDRIVRRAQLVATPDPVHIALDHSLSALAMALVLEHESPLEWSLQPPECGRRDYSLGGRPYPHQHVDVRIRVGGVQSRGNVAIADEDDVHVVLFQITYQLLVARPVHNHHSEL